MTEFVWLIVITNCSGCFRLERLLGGTSTHWKAPPLHGAADIDWAIWLLPLSPPSKSLRWRQSCARDERGCDRSD